MNKLASSSSLLGSGFTGTLFGGDAEAVLRRRKYAVMKEAAARPPPMKPRRAVSRIRDASPQQQSVDREPVNLKTVYILYANRNSQMRLSSDSPQRLDIFLVLAVRRA